jgi:hypothetical protein
MPTAILLPQDLPIPTIPREGTATLIPVTPANNACSIPPNWTTYTVQGDETLYAVAQAADSTVGELVTVNCLNETQDIGTGDMLFVPRSIGGTVATNVPVIPQSGVPYSSEGCVSGVQITTLTPGQIVTGAVTIAGEANLPAFNAYRLEVRPAFTDQWDFYSLRFEPQPRGELDIINTDFYDDGLHIIRLIVVTGGVRYQTCAIPVIFR